MEEPYYRPSRPRRMIKQEPEVDPADAISDWFQTVMMWPLQFLMFSLRLIGRFSKLAVLLSMGALIYHQIYVCLVPPSLSESHAVNFVYPAESDQRKGGLPANASVDFAFQRQLMVREGRRGMDWSSGQNSGSSLDVGVSFVLPESDVNRDVSTFMVHVEVFDKQGKISGSGSRSVVMRHKSWLLQLMTTVAWSIPMLLHLTEEQQTLKTTVVQLVSFPTSGLHSATVSISDSRLQVYNAYIDITFVLVGFRYYMYHWYFTCLFFGTLVISNILLAFLRWAVRRLFGTDFVTEEDAMRRDSRDRRKSGGVDGREGAGESRFEEVVSSPDGTPSAALRKSKSDTALPGGPSGGKAKRGQHGGDDSTDHDEAGGYESTSSVDEELLDSLQAGGRGDTEAQDELASVQLDFVDGSPPSRGAGGSGFTVNADAVRAAAASGSMRRRNPAAGPGAAAAPESP